MFRLSISAKTLISILFLIFFFASFSANADIRTYKGVRIINVSGEKIRFLIQANPGCGIVYKGRRNDNGRLKNKSSGKCLAVRSGHKVDLWDCKKKAGHVTANTWNRRQTL